MSNLTFSDLMTALATRDKEYDPTCKADLMFRANEMAGEAGEACNVVKKLYRSKLGLAGGLDYDTAKEMLTEELADVVICAVLCALKLSVDLGPAIVSKFNKTSDKLGLETKIGV